MASLVVFDVDLDEELRRVLVENAGFKTSIGVYYPASAPVDTDRWLTKDELPKNMLFHSELNCQQACQLVHNEPANQATVPIKVIGFEVGNIHVVWPGNPVFDHSAPSKRLADFKKD